MKKNLLGAIVIFFVTVAFLLMLDDMSKSRNSQLDHSVEIYNVPAEPIDMATTDVAE